MKDILDEFIVEQKLKEIDSGTPPPPPSRKRPSEDIIGTGQDEKKRKLEEDAKLKQDQEVKVLKDRQDAALKEVKEKLRNDVAEKKKADEKKKAEDEKLNIPIRPKEEAKNEDAGARRSLLDQAGSFLARRRAAREAEARKKRGEE